MNDLRIRLCQATSVDDPVAPFKCRWNTRQMTGLEVAAITLGTSVIKSACGIWLGENKLAEGFTGGVLDIIAGRLQSPKEQRQSRRLWDQAAEIVAERVEPAVRQRYPRLPENERIAAIQAVSDTISTARLTESDIFARDLDAAYLNRYLRSAVPDAVKKAGLSEDAEALYEWLLRESCGYTIEVVQTLPRAGISALQEVLRRESQMLQDLRTVLERLPERRAVADFESDYRQLVANTMDHVEFFGASMSEASRRYPLSVAYLSLKMATGSQPGSGRLRVQGTSRVEEVLASNNRLFVRGQAGLGKTTLLQWIAVNSARNTFREKMSDWNGTVPFFVPLRRHANYEMPGADQFTDEIGRHISAEMPPAWVQSQLRARTGLVLIDGVDELPEGQRQEARKWLRQLITTFPQARYVVTSRPSAVPPNWLSEEGFLVADLEPMTRSDIPIFVHRWHEAMREQAKNVDEVHELNDFESRLIEGIGLHRHLRQLSGYPLLCALLCALHRDRRAQLPGNRMELYEVALQMFLERRDSERRIHNKLELTRTDQTLLLQDIAYWLVRNGQSEAPVSRITERIASKLESMAQISEKPHVVYKTLLERTGLIREPIVGQVDFVHKSFQEYLAAKAAVEMDDIGMLASHAHLDQWTEVVVMAAGHASMTKRTQLLEELLARAKQSGSGDADSLRLVAVACIENSPELPPELRARLESVTVELLPPKTMTAARSIARAGAFVIDLLNGMEIDTDEAICATVSAVAEIGDPSAMELISRFRDNLDPDVQSELYRAWPRFEAEEYARLVLRGSAADRPDLVINDASLMPGLRQLQRLQDLKLETQTPVHLDVVRDLTALRRLTVREAVDLTGLTDSQLEELFVGEEDWLGSRGYLDLTPLSTLSRLKYLTLHAKVQSGAGALTGLTSLETINLGSNVPYDIIQAMTSASVRIADIDSTDYIAAAPTMPRSWRLNHLGLLGNPRLMELDALRSHRETLTSLSLDVAEGADLSPLTELHKVRQLRVFPFGSLDLSPIASMPSLRRLRVGPVAGSSALAHIQSQSYVPSRPDIPTFGGSQVKVEVIKWLRNPPRRKDTLLGAVGFPVQWV
jgi:hypothetical protein